MTVFIVIGVLSQDEIGADRWGPSKPCQCRYDDDVRVEMLELK
jgi:hypothetical protein